MPILHGAKKKASINTIILNSSLQIPKTYINKIEASNPEVWENAEQALVIRNVKFDQLARFSKTHYFRKSVPEYISYIGEDDDSYLLPRNFPLKDYGFTDFKISDERIDGKNISGKSSISLWDYQKEFYEEVVETNSDDVVFQVPCGKGKTILALYRAFEIGKVTMVFVPTYFLARQWIKQIKTKSTASYHLLKSTDKSIPVDKDFYICSMDLMAVRDLPQSFVDIVGHVILDEAHRSGADSYIPMLLKIPARYRTALSATFRRPDGVHVILQHHFGVPIKMHTEFEKPAFYAFNTGIEVKSVISKIEKRKTVPNVAENIIEIFDDLNEPYVETASAIAFTYSDKLYAKFGRQLKSKNWPKKIIATCLRNVKKGKETNYSTLSTYLAEHYKRNKLIVKLIEEAHNSGRKIFVIAKRKKVLKTLYKIFKDRNACLVVQETNSDETMEKVAQADLIFGVPQLVKEGADAPQTDTLFLLDGVIDTEQAVGRITREYKGKKSPVAVSFVDNNFYCLSMLQKSKKFIALNAEFKGHVDFNKLVKILN